MRLRALGRVVREEDDGVDRQVVFFRQAGEVAEHALGEVGLGGRLVLHMFIANAIQINRKDVLF